MAKVLKGASKVAEPGPADRFQLRLASSLTGMVARELALQDGHRESHQQRLRAAFQSSEDPEQALLERIGQADLAENDWAELLILLRADLADQLEVIAPQFDTRLDAENP